MAKNYSATKHLYTLNDSVHIHKIRKIAVKYQSQIYNL